MTMQMPKSTCSNLLNSILIILITMFCCACSPGPKLVFSEGFENITSQDKAFTQWHWKHGQGKLELSANSLNGSQSLYFKAETEKYWCLSSDDFAITTDSPCVVTASIKTTQGAAPAGVRLVATTDEKEIYSRIRDVACVFEHGKWKTVMNNIVLPENSKTLRIEFCVVGRSEGWIDDIQIKPWKQPEGKKVPLLSKARLPEKLSRGTAAVASSDSIHISWRLLNADKSNITFDLYRQAEKNKAVKINSSPISQTTDFTDKNISPDTNYKYAAVTVGSAPEPTDWSNTINLSKACKNYISIPLKGNYVIHKLGVGDLDGDGHLDYVIQQPDKNVDPYSKPGYWHKSEGTYKLEAYRHDGKFLWQYDLGWSIEQGTWYSPYIVYDMNQDGRCEVIVKTGNGDPRNSGGKVTSGEEFLTILDGLTGKIITQRYYEPKRGEITGPHAYNRYDSRNQFAIAYLDGNTPCLIVERGTYELVIAQAFWLNNDKLEKLWQWRSDQWGHDNWGQGAHSIKVADVDADQREEVLLGCLMLDDDGTTLWTSGQGHPDHCYMGDLIPDRKGMEIYMGLETQQAKDGYGMVDAATGERIWGWDEKTNHIHSSGLVADLDPTRAGAECYGRDKNRGKPLAWWFDAQGNVLSREDLNYSPRAAYWDADPQRELIAQKPLEDFSTQIISQPIEGRILAITDIFGDWREEIITSVAGEMRIYSTPVPAKNMNISLLQDPVYRRDVTVQSNAYLQIPTLSYDMATKAKSDDDK